MEVVERYYWQPTDVDVFVKLHREFHDKHLKKAGASDMKLWQDRSNWKNFHRRSLVRKLCCNR